MKKSLTAIAVAAALTVPFAANAGFYGKGHVAVAKTGDAEMMVDTQKKRANAIGAKGSVDTTLMDFKAVYKAEIGLNGDNGSFFERDTNIGLSSKTLGTVRAGTISVAYKMSGKMIDPNFTTPFEGRGGLGMMSGQHGGTGDGKGRSTNTVTYASPKIAGMATLNAHYNLAEGTENNMGGGLVVATGPAHVFADYMTTTPDTAWTKFGAKVSMSGVTLGAQYEMYADSNDSANDSSGMFVNVAYAMGASSVNVSYGTAEDSHASWALVGQHKISKTAKIYAGYGSMAPEVGDSEATYGGGMVVAF